MDSTDDMARYGESVSDAVRLARPADLPRIAAIEDSGLVLFEQELGDLAGTALASPAPATASRRPSRANPTSTVIANERQLGLPDFGRRVLMRRTLRTPDRG